MKPYIIFVKGQPKNGEVTIKEKDLKELLEKAYNDGYMDGNKSNWWYANTITTTNNPLPTYLTNPTEPKPYTYKYEVTCDNTSDAMNSIGD